MAKYLFLIFLIILSNICNLLRANEPNSFAFTVTADSRSKRTRFRHVLSEITDKVGDEGVFHISPGDIDPPADNYQDLVNKFGSDVIWYSVVGNHEIDNPPSNPDIAWIRDEYNYGHNPGGIPLKEYTNQDGPAGSVETTYSWDYSNAHFIALNEYWNGKTSSGSDMATSGDIVGKLYVWLVKNLSKNTKPIVFVFGHEPAYPENRHIGDSLDQYKTNRNRFWKLLNDMKVTAYICGHTHTYYRKQVGSSKWEPFTWQIDVGNAGNISGGDSHQTFLDVTVSDSGEVWFDIWQGTSGDFKVKDSWSVMAPIKVDMKLTPRLLNSKSKGNWIKAHFILPDDFTIEDVNANTPVTIEPLGIESDYINTFINQDGLAEIEAAFDRASFCGAAMDYYGTNVRIFGLLTNGRYFYGTDRIKIISHNLRNIELLSYQWLKSDCNEPEWCDGFDIDHNFKVDLVDFALMEDCYIEVLSE